MLSHEVFAHARGTSASRTGVPAAETVLTSAERDELARLRRENGRLRRDEEAKALGTDAMPVASPALFKEVAGR